MTSCSLEKLYVGFSSSSNETNERRFILAKLHTAVSSGDVYSMISVQFPVSIPLKIPRCLFVSLKQYVGLYFLFSFTDLTLINCRASRFGLL